MKKILLLALLFTQSALASDLRGAIVIAADGTFLGTCEGTTGTNSISNSYSKYGNEYGSHSMFNTYGRYGGEYSNYSPYNEYTNNAPYLIGYDLEIYQMFTSYDYQPSERIISILRSSGFPHVTVNRYATGAIDPDALRAYCRNP